MKLYFSTVPADLEKRCWFPEDKKFEKGKKIRAYNYECCSIGLITHKTDKSLWMTSPTSKTSYCITIEGMPYKKNFDFDTKRLKLDTGK